MADDQTNNPENNQQKVPEQEPGPGKENTHQIEQQNERSTNAGGNNESIANREEPLLVKVVETKGWKRGEIVEIFGIILGLFVLFVTYDTFKQTKRAVDISAQALLDSRRKDTIDDARREYETRPIVQLADIKHDRAKITANIINMSAFPAIVQSAVAYFLYAESMSTTQIENVAHANPTILNTAVSNTTVVPYKVMGQSISDQQYRDFKSGKTFAYFWGEIKYMSIGNGKQYSLKYLYRITETPQYSVITFQNDIVLIP